MTLIEDRWTRSVQSLTTTRCKSLDSHGWRKMDTYEGGVVKRPVVENIVTQGHIGLGLNILCYFLSTFSFLLSFYTFKLPRILSHHPGWEGWISSIKGAGIFPMTFSHPSKISQHNILLFIFSLKTNVHFIKPLSPILRPTIALRPSRCSDVSFHILMEGGWIWIAKIIPFPIVKNMKTHSS